MRKKSNDRFDIAYGNLTELFRRIYAVDYDYPAQICAVWFVDELNEILGNEVLKSRLTLEHIDQISEMGTKLIRTTLLEGWVKGILNERLKELVVLKSNLTSGAGLSK